MGALGELIDTAVFAVIVEHPKLFDARNKEKARKVIVREIMKTLLREPADIPAETTAEAESPQRTIVPIDDPRAVAYCNLRRIAGAVAPMQQNNQIVLPPEADTTAVRVFGDIGDRKSWVFIFDVRMLAAWQQFFAETLPGIACRTMGEIEGGKAGRWVPWPWPPSKTGKIYEPAQDEEIAV